MIATNQREIVINGVRYNVAIRLDMSWSYVAEWWNDSEFHQHALPDSVRSISKTDREAVSEIHKARFEQEPWLHVEMA